MGKQATKSKDKSKKAPKKTDAEKELDAALAASDDGEDAATGKDGSDELAVEAGETLQSRDRKTEAAR